MAEIFEMLSPEILAPDRLSAGEPTMHRRLVSTTAVAVGSGTVRLSYFTARKSETKTQVRMMTGGTAAGATPTLCRAGMWTVAANGDITLIASIVNDTALFVAGSTVYTRILSVAYDQIAGQRYAFGLLVVTGATAPTFTGQNSLNAAEALLAPRIGGGITGQTDLPTGTTVNASIVPSGSLIYAVLLP